MSQSMEHNQPKQETKSPFSHANELTEAITPTPERLTEVPLPPLEPTGRAADIPAALRDKLPELKSREAIPLSEAAMTNISHFATTASSLEPGQTTSVMLEDLNSFRAGGLYQEWPYDENETEQLRKSQTVPLPYPDVEPGEFSELPLNRTIANACTDIDTFAALATELGFTEASFEDTLRAVRFIDENDLSYAETPAAVRGDDIEIKFYMTEHYVNSEGEAFYRMGVKASRPTDNLTSDTSKITLPNA
jgi:hypothetical protein